MAQSPAPAPEEWRPPESDQEFVFTGIQDAPAWIDKGWASFKQGPALALPAGDIMGWTGPYTTKAARIGDKVVFTAAKGAQPARFDVIPGDPAPEQLTPRPAQQSAAQLEDLLKLGYITPDQLGADARWEVAVRSPGMKRLVEESVNLPEKQNIAEQILSE